MSFPPHIFAGISSILALISSDSQIEESEPFVHDLLMNHKLASNKTTKTTNKRKAAKDDVSKEEEFYRERVTTLIVAVFFIVYSRKLGMSVPNPAREIPPINEKTYENMLQAAISCVGLPDVCVSGSKAMEEVDTWILLIVRWGWTNGHEWYENVPELTRDEVDQLQGEREKAQLQATEANKEIINGEDEDEDEDVVSPAKRMLKTRKVSRSAKDTAAQPDDRSRLLPGLGTMMHDDLDFLSDEKMREYAMWRARIMRWVDTTEACK